MKARGDSERARHGAGGTALTTSSASRYRQIEQDEVFYEKPAVTLDRMRALERAGEEQVAELERMLANGAGKE